MFDTEAEMVKVTLPYLLDEFNCRRYIEEPKGLFGIPDLVMFNGKIISIEYKLRNWKQALRQAYRYKSFSEESYVVIDKSYLKKPRENLDAFAKFNIGLAAVDKDNVEIYYKPKSVKPFSAELTDKALSLF